MIAVTQVSNAATRRNAQQAAAAASCPPAVKQAQTKDTRTYGRTPSDGKVRNYPGDQGPVTAPRTTRQQSQPAPQQNPACTPAQLTAGENDRNRTNNQQGRNQQGRNQNQPGRNQNQPDQDQQEEPPAPEQPEQEANQDNNGLDILGDTCEGSRLNEHDGFQNGNRCVTTQFGEVGNAATNPSLLITEAPEQVNRNQAFQLKVSTRNLKRDRFLGAAAGGYYLESSFLDGQGLVRGHFHTACRMLQSENEAVDPAPAPAFFVATEDGRGSGNPDEVTIQVTGLPQRGTAQCASWAGDGSHRIPMMERANQIPAFDTVRIRVN